jgi:hypothetical protein
MALQKINLGTNPNDKNGDSARVAGQKINANTDIIAAEIFKDAVLQSGFITTTGLNLSIAANEFAWRINQQEFLTPASYSTTLVAAAAGFYRADIVVGTNTGTYQIVQGVPSATVAVEPDVPTNTIRLAGIVLFGAVVGNPTPTPTTNFVEKSELANVVLTGSGVINMLTLVDEKSTIVFKGAVTRLNTITYNSVPYSGKRITLFNAQNTPVTIGNSVSGFGVDFVFPDGQDYVLQPNQTIEFSYDLTYLPYAHHMFIGGSQTVDQSIIDGSTNPVSSGAVYNKIIEIDDDQIEISGNVIMLDSWSKKTILITGNSTITVPATLLAKYGFSWYLLPGVSLSWAITPPFTWGMTAPTTITGGTEGVYGVLNRRGSTNTIYLGQ